MIIHGINSVKEALSSGMAVKEIYVAERRDSRIAEIAELASRRRVKLVIRDRGFFKGVGGQAAQFVAARVDTNLTPFEDLLADQGSGLFLVLDQIEDPRNLGAILRTASATGVDGVVIQTHRACGITPTVFAASAGAVSHLRIAEVPNIKNAARTFKEEGFQVVGADSTGEKTLWDANLNGPTVLVLGSEGKGMRKTVRDLCDEVIRIPMAGKVSSLNVSVASGVILYEVLRQRGRKTK
jgi:23S rRNA (guanosine2251-2'-O)-methyltransferase